MDWITEHFALLERQDEKDRIERIARAATSYQGDAPPPLRLSPDGFDDNVRLNFARLIVDKGVAFLFGKGPEITLDDQSEQSSKEEASEAMWEASGGLLAMQRLAVNGGIAGHAIAKLVEGDPLPRIVVIDPQNFSMKWRGDDHEVITEYAITWTSYDEEERKVVGRRQRIVPNEDGRSWEIIDEKSSSQDGGRWREISRVTWGYPFAPIVHAQNLPASNEVYGRADLEHDVLDLIEAIEFAVSNINRILRFHAHPLWWTNAEGDLTTLDRAIGRIVRFPKNTEINKLEMDSDLSSAMEFARGLRESLHEVSRIPEIAVGKVENVGNLSGIALQILYQPLIEKTDQKRLTYGRLISEITRRGLIIGGQGEHKANVSWPEMLPADSETLIADQALGIVSKRTLAAKRGYDFDVELLRMEEETSGGPTSTEDVLSRMMASLDRSPAPGEGEPPDGSP